VLACDMKQKLLSEVTLEWFSKEYAPILESELGALAGMSRHTRGSLRVLAGEAAIRSAIDVTMSDKDKVEHVLVFMTFCINLKKDIDGSVDYTKANEILNPDGLIYVSEAASLCTYEEWVEMFHTHEETDHKNELTYFRTHSHTYSRLSYGHKRCDLAANSNHDILCQKLFGKDGRPLGKTVTETDAVHLFSGAQNSRSFRDACSRLNMHTLNDLGVEIVSYKKSKVNILPLYISPEKA
jgi:hypothetical protein